MGLEEDTQYPIVEVYDSELLKIEKVLEALAIKQRTSVNLEAFRKEIVERFAEIGFVVYAKIYETNQEGVFAFAPELRGRTEAFVWDPDQMVHEVTEDILDLLPESEKGQTIKTQHIRPGEANTHKHHT